MSAPNLSLAVEVFQCWDDALPQMQALADAISILNQIRAKTAGAGDAPWLVVYHASQYLNHQLAAIMAADVEAHS